MEDPKQYRPPAATDTATTGRASRGVHFASVILMAVTVLIATADGFAQSYAGLYHWALEHSLHGWKAKSFPLMVDLFIGVGELGLFALALEGHRLKGWLARADLALPIAIATAGWSVSLAFNIGAVRPEWSDRLTAAVPPVASMLGLLVLLRTLHRLVTRGPTVPAAAVEPVDDVPGADVERVDVEQIFNRPQLGSAEGGDAGQPGFITLADAVLSTRAAGISQQDTADAFHITKYRVQQIEKQQASAAEPATPDVPATLNGHAPALAGGETS